jgi:Ion transport protein
MTCGLCDKFLCLDASSHPHPAIQISHLLSRPLPANAGKNCRHNVSPRTFIDVYYVGTRVSSQSVISLAFVVWCVNCRHNSCRISCCTCAVLKLLRVAQTVRAVLYTVLKALPQVGNLALLFFLLSFIFAALGVELFGHIGKPLQFGS